MHLDSKGRECGRPDGHKGSHATREALLRAYRRYNGSAKGMLRNVRMNARRRSGA